MGRRPTITGEVRKLLADGRTRTCMEILHQLGDPCNSDTLSSMLLKLGRKGELEMAEKFGPRGGRGYRLASAPAQHCGKSEQCADDTFCNCPCYDCSKCDCYRPGCTCKRTHPQVRLLLERW